MESYDECSFCGGEVTETLGELDYRYKENLFVIKNVGFGCCTQCGEKYLKSKIAKEIEERLIKNNWNYKIEIPVLELQGI